MNRDVPPKGIDLEKKEGLKEEYLFSKDTISNEHSLDKVFDVPNFADIKRAFIEGKAGKFFYSMKIDTGAESVYIKNNENNPILATSFEEMKDKIREWIRIELLAKDNIGENENLKIKSFELLNYYLEKDGEEKYIGGRTIISDF